MKRIPCLIRILIQPVLDREQLPEDVKERISIGVSREIARYMNDTNDRVQQALGTVALSLESARQEMDVRLWSHLAELEMVDEASKVEKGNP